MLDVMECTREDEARALIDRGLSLASGRDLISADEFTNLLLDLRVLFPLPEKPEEETVTPE